MAVPVDVGAVVLVAGGGFVRVGVLVGVKVMVGGSVFVGGGVFEGIGVIVGVAIVKLLETEQLPQPGKLKTRFALKTPAMTFPFVMKSASQ